MHDFVVVIEREESESEVLLTQKTGEFVVVKTENVEVSAKNVRDAKHKVERLYPTRRVVLIERGGATLFSNFRKDIPYQIGY